MGDKMAVVGDEGHASLDQLREFSSAPRLIRTADLLIRSQTLYPTELWARRAKSRTYVIGPSCATTDSKATPKTRCVNHGLTFRNLARCRARCSASARAAASRSRKASVSPRS